MGGLNSQVTLKRDKTVVLGMSHHAILLCFGCTTIIDVRSPGVQVTVYTYKLNMVGDILWHFMW